jgi:glycosyltransferase involved in cell wall biosynthesis
VVATKLPGTIPFLAGEEDGIIYAETADTVNILIQLLSDPEKCRRLGERGVEAARRFDWIEIARQMASWLTELATD